MTKKKKIILGVTVAGAAVLTGAIIYYCVTKQKVAPVIVNQQPLPLPKNNVSSSKISAPPLNCKSAPSNPSQTRNEVTESIKEALGDGVRKMSDAPFDVHPHVRKLSNGQHASDTQKKAAEAAGRFLEEGETYVNGYTKNKDCA